MDVILKPRATIPMDHTPAHVMMDLQEMEPFAVVGNTEIFEISLLEGISNTGSNVCVALSLFMYNFCDSCNFSSFIFVNNSLYQVGFTFMRGLIRDAIFAK